MYFPATLFGRGVSDVRFGRISRIATDDSSLHLSPQSTASVRGCLSCKSFCRFSLLYGNFDRVKIIIHQHFPILRKTKCRIFFKMVATCRIHLIFTPEFHLGYWTEIHRYLIINILGKKKNFCLIPQYSFLHCIESWRFDFNFTSLLYNTITYQVTQKKLF